MSSIGFSNSTNLAPAAAGFPGRDRPARAEETERLQAANPAVETSEELEQRRPLPPVVESQHGESYDAQRRETERDRAEEVDEAEATRRARPRDQNAEAEAEAESEDTALVGAPPFPRTSAHDLIHSPILGIEDAGDETDPQVTIEQQAERISSMVDKFQQLLGRIGEFLDRSTSSEEPAAKSAESVNLFETAEGEPEATAAPQGDAPALSTAQQEEDAAKKVSEDRKGADTSLSPGGDSGPPAEEPEAPAGPLDVVL